MSEANEVTAFKTRSEILSITMPRVIGNNQHKRDFIIALDGGYSSVKGISETTLFCFPSYAKRIPSIDVVGRLNPTDLILTDHRTGEMWLVGAFAENTMDRTDIQTTTDESLYTRYRYKSDVYKVIMTAGLGISLYNTPTDENLVLHVQTGLPSAYVKKDAATLREVLAGSYDFTLRIGTMSKRFTFRLKADNIGVMEQPRGTLANIVYDKDGHLVPQLRDILNSDTLILDIGFGTEDIFSIRSGSNIKDNRNKTYGDTAMKAVFESCVNEINDRYDTEFKVFELQKFLKRGKVPVLDRSGDIIRTEEVPFLELLDSYNHTLCEKSINRLLKEYNDLLDYRYLIVTGGTGESRIGQIHQMLSGLPHLQVLLGNESDPSISSIYSNVRGYYMSMLLKVQKATKAENGSVA